MPIIILPIHDTKSPLELKRTTSPFRAPSNNAICHTVFVFTWIRCPLPFRTSQSFHSPCLPCGPFYSETPSPWRKTYYLPDAQRWQPCYHWSDTTGCWALLQLCPLVIVRPYMDAPVQARAQYGWRVEIWERGRVSGGREVSACACVRARRRGSSAQVGQRPGWWRVWLIQGRS